jgi:Zn-dependent protease with chaperone function
MAQQTDFVMGHELSHVRHNDMLTTGVLWPTGVLSALLLHLQRARRKVVFWFPVVETAANPPSAGSDRCSMGFDLCCRRRDFELVDGL